MPPPPPRNFILTRDDEDAGRGVSTARCRLRRFHRDLSFLNTGLPGLSMAELAEKMIPLRPEVVRGLQARRRESLRLEEDVGDRSETRRVTRSARRSQQSQSGPSTPQRVTRSSAKSHSQRTRSRSAQSSSQQSQESLGLRFSSTPTPVCWHIR